MQGTSDHPIKVFPAGVSIRAEAYGRVYIDSAHPVAVEEAGYPTVYYAPEADVQMRFLERSDTVTACPHKGTATWYHAITPHGGRVEDAVWKYDNPPEDMAAIKGLYAFYTDKLDLIREMPDGEEIL